MKRSFLVNQNSSTIQTMLKKDSRKFCLINTGIELRRVFDFDRGEGKHCSDNRTKQARSRRS